MEKKRMGHTTYQNDHGQRGQPIHCAVIELQVVEETSIITAYLIVRVGVLLSYCTLGQGDVPYAGVSELWTFWKAI